MKFGVCTGLEDATAILEAGFDYVELGASAFNGLSDDWDPAPYAGLPIGATNLFFDSRIKLFGPEKTPYLDYAKRTVERGASLSVPIMVIGSGGSRRSPDGSNQDGAFFDIVAQISEYARTLGISLAPESLNRTETNVGNDLRGLALGLKERGVGYTADSYHVLFEWDADGRTADLGETWREQLPFAPTHVHIADLPRLGVDADDAMLRGFAARLAEFGYDGSVSLECSRGTDFNYRSTLRTLKFLFGAE